MRPKLDPLYESITLGSLLARIDANYDRHKCKSNRLMSGKFRIEYGNDKMRNEMEMAVGVLKLFWLIKSCYRLISRLPPNDKNWPDQTGLFQPGLLYLRLKRVDK